MSWTLSSFIGTEVIPIELPAGMYSSGTWLPEIRPVCCTSTLGAQLHMLDQGDAGPLDAVYRPSVCLGLVASGLFQ